MPRGPRLDAPDTLHHVMVRGLERRALFRDGRDRADLLARLAAVAQRTGLRVLAWPLLPNHFHLLLLTPRPRLGHAIRHTLAPAMRSLLTGYAGVLNRRHRRGGHLVQNWYKSNPGRGGTVPPRARALPALESPAGGPRAGSGDAGPLSLEWAQRPHGAAGAPLAGRTRGAGPLRADPPGGATALLAVRGGGYRPRPPLGQDSA